MASDASVSLGLDFVQFRSGLAQAQKAFEHTTKTMKNLALTTAGLLGVKFSYDAFKSGVEGALKAGRQLDLLSKQSQVSAQDIALMTHALDRSGQSTESTSHILEEFRNNMLLGTKQIGPLQQQLKYLGLNFESISKQSLPEQFEAIANEVNKLQDPMQKAALAEKLFGSEGAKAAAALQSGDIANAAKLFGKNAEAEAKASQQLARVSVSFDRIKTQGTIIFGQIAGKLAPYLERATAELEQLLPKIEETVSDWIDGTIKIVGILYNAFAQGKIGELLWLSLQVGAMKAINFFVIGWKTSMSVVKELMNQAMSILVQKEFWVGFSDAIIGAFMIAGNKGMEIFMRVFETPLKFLQDGFTYIFEKIQEGFTDMFRWLFDQLSKIPKVGDYFKDNKPQEYKAQSFSDVRKEGQLSLFGSTQGDFRKNSEEGFRLITKAGENLSVALDKSGANWESIVKSFMDGLKEQGVFGESLTEKQKELMSLVDTLMPKGPAKTDEQKKKETKMGAAGFAQTSFDEFRRIGGGAGNAASNVGQRQLDRLTEIRNILQKNPKGNNLGQTAKAMSGILPVGGY